MKNIVLTVPNFFLKKYSKLNNPAPWNNTITLDISKEIGHILVHYLITNTYQNLEPKGSTPDEKIDSKLTTNIQIYAMVREYEMSILEELVKVEIKKLGKGLPFSAVLKVARSAYPNPRINNIWFNNYIAAGFEPFFKDFSKLADCVPKAEFETLPIMDLLFKITVDLVCSNEALLKYDATDLYKAVEKSAGSPLPKIDLLSEAALCQTILIRPGQEVELECRECEPTPRSGLEPEIVPEPAPQPENPIQDYDWGAPSKKKKKKKRMKVEEPHPEVEEPHPEVEEPHPEVEEPHPEVEEPHPEIEELHPEVEEPHPEVEEPHPVDCGSRFQHYSGQGLEGCLSCQRHIYKLSRMFPVEC